MSQPRIDHRRRHICLAALACSVVAPAGAQVVGADHGRVDPPVPMPAIALRCADGTSTNLAALLRGRATALHLMFTTCSTVCPIQGAIFARVQSLLPDQDARGIQLLSIGIDPGSDSPPSMRAWLKRYDARAGWTAAAPESDGLDAVLGLFGQGRNAVENHTTQVNIIDRKANLVFRTPPLPSPDSLAELLRRV
jgi:protein SCO1/2